MPVLVSAAIGNVAEHESRIERRMVGLGLKRVRVDCLREGNLVGRAVKRLPLTLKPSALNVTNTSGF